MSEFYVLLEHHPIAVGIAIVFLSIGLATALQEISFAIRRLMER